MGGSKAKTSPFQLKSSSEPKAEGSWRHCHPQQEMWACVESKVRVLLQASPWVLTYCPTFREQPSGTGSRESIWAGSTVWSCICFPTPPPNGRIPSTWWTTCLVSLCSHADITSAKVSLALDILAGEGYKNPRESPWSREMRTTPSFYIWLGKRLQKPNTFSAINGRLQGDPAGAFKTKQSKWHQWTELSSGWMLSKSNRLRVEGQEGL